jgi:hypothetical protein
VEGGMSLHPVRLSGTENTARVSTGVPHSRLFYADIHLFFRIKMSEIDKKKRSGKCKEKSKSRRAV